MADSSNGECNGTSDDGEQKKPESETNEQTALADSEKLNCSVADSSCEDVITLQDIMETQAQLEKDAEDLLGGESGKVCTYPQGYKPRQPIYSCKDCTKEGSKAGICYGCSINCHDGHDLVELYTKRNFCCDCGNSKFKNTCKLYEEKKPLNDLNKYNHNFDGIYCTCNQPYTGDEDMYQCCICEDWFHLQHLVEEVNGQIMDDVEEIVCKICSKRLPFLQFYADESYNKELATSNQCLIQKFGKVADQTCDKALFFRSYHWRERLCKCKNCLNLYEDADVSFITDSSDCVEEFVQNNRKSAEPKLLDSSEDKKVDRIVVETVGRETAITLFAGFEEMKQKVFAAMKRAADEGREVRKEDINAAFAELESARKRRRITEVTD
uniref:UBR-type domain-containing protein n=1 Tax=Syphacia muris TaxID=451379 RepID=A0A0N5AIP1_9BILA